MPQFHFDVTDGTFTPDLTGLELPDIPAARAHAIERMTELLASHTEAFWLGQEWLIEVRDDCGLVLFTLAFRATESPVARRTRPSG
jgi:hypothetical protein